MEVSGKRLETTEESTAEGIGKLCELCEPDHATTTANGKCRECMEHMCLTCFRHHLKAKSCRHHVLLETRQSTTPVQKRAKDVEKCDMHANETIKFYCRMHETVGCGECMIPEHVVCQPENIKDLSNGFQHNEDFKSRMRKLETIMSANRENDKRVQESQRTNKNMIEKALKEIKTFRVEINNYLDRAEESIIKEATDIEREHDILLAKLAQDCMKLSSRITEVRQKLDAKMYQDSALFIQTVECKPRVLEIEREVARIQKENDIKTFQFMPDKQLQGIITASEKLGSITKLVHTSPIKPDRSTEANAVSRKDRKYTIRKEKKEVVVGTRVRPIGDWLKRGMPDHEGEPGTVTAVNEDGTVIVKWDGTGRLWRSIGIGGNVELM